MNSCLAKLVLFSAATLLFWAISHFAWPVVSQIRDNQIAQGEQLSSGGKISKEIPFAGNFYEHEVESGRYRVGKVSEVLFKGKYRAVELQIQDQRGRFWVIVGSMTLQDQVYPGDDVVISSKSMGVISLHQ